MLVQGDLNRQQIRQFYRQQRKALSPSEQRKAGQDLLAQCLQTPLLDNANNIACYLANDGEIDLSPLIEYCWRHNKQIYLPVLHPFAKGYLLFITYQPNSNMQLNKFGISEPRISCPKICPVEQLDIIFTPLVAFDMHGHRLGMGGGFYDRTLAPLQRFNAQTQVIGVAHNCQRATSSLKAERWDIPMQKIITPDKVYSCKH